MAGRPHFPRLAVAISLIQSIKKPEEMPPRENSIPSAISSSDGWDVADKGINKALNNMERFASASIIPKNHRDPYFDLVCVFVEKKVPEEAVVQRSGALYASYCFTIFRNLRSSCTNEEFVPYAHRFAQMWTCAFAWARYILRAIERFSIRDKDKKLCIQLARGISHFLSTASLLNETVERLREESVLNFIADFWATESNVPEIMDEKADALNSCASCVIRTVELDMLLDRIQMTIGTAEKVALRSIANARLSMWSIPPGEAPEVTGHYDVLFMMILKQPKHSISKAILDAGVVPFLFESLSPTINGTNPSDLSFHHCSWIALCAITLLGIYRTSKDGLSWMRQGFEHDQVGVLFMMGKLFDRLDPYEQNFVLDAFSEIILPSMHLADIALPTLRGMRRFFENRSQIGDFPARFTPLWAEFETCLLEHAILRHTHKLGYWDVYCDNVLCHTKMSLGALRRCAGCHLAMYCSRRCQRSAWMSGHRTKCGEISRHGHAHAAISTNDKSYLLHWVVTHLSPLVPALRRIAHVQFRQTPFVKVGLYVDLSRWPATVLMHPLQQGLYADESHDMQTPHAMHFRDLAMKRVDQGNGSATMLTIRCKNKRGMGLHYAIVDLEKNPPEGQRRNGDSARMRCRDRNGNPIVAMRDSVDLLIEQLKRAAIREERNIWSPGFLWTHVRAALNID